MTTQYPILWLVLCGDHLLFLVFNVAVCEEESVSDMFFGKVIHQDFLNPSFGRHWTWSGSRPQIPLWDDKQLSKPHLSVLWLSYISVPSVSSILLLSSCCCCLLSWAFSSLTNGDLHHSGFKFQTVVLCVLCVWYSKYKVSLEWIYWMFSWYGFQIFP